MVENWLWSILLLLKRCCFEDNWTDKNLSFKSNSFHLMVTWFGVKELIMLVDLWYNALVRVIRNVKLDLLKVVELFVDELRDRSKTKELNFAYCFHSRLISNGHIVCFSLFLSFSLYKSERLLICERMETINYILSEMTLLIVGLEDLQNIISLN